MAWMHPQDRLFCEIAVQLNLLSREQVARCMQMQQREASGQTIAALATTLGFLDQAAVDRVMHQQQRVLERRREAREASRKKREAESRAAAGLGPHGSVSPSEQPKPEESLPKAAELLAQAQLDSHEVRETLDVRPPQRQVGRATLRDKLAPANDVGPRAPAVQVTAPLPHARAPELPPEAAGAPSLSPGQPARRTGARDPRQADVTARRTGMGVGPPLQAAARRSTQENAARAILDDDDDEVERAVASLFPSADDAAHIELGLEDSAPARPSDVARTSRRTPTSLQPGDHAGAMAPTTPVDAQAVEAQYKRSAFSTQLGAGPAFSPEISAQPGTIEAAPSHEARSAQPSAAPAPHAGHSPAPRESRQLERSSARAPREAVNAPAHGATSAPPREPAGAATSTAPPQRAGAGVRGTLLETSGREQLRRQQDEHAPLASPAPITSRPHAPAAKSARPVPAGRDWRNPSRPPPPSVGLDIELSPLTAATPAPGTATGALGGRVVKAPPLDTPRYVDRALELCAEFGGSDLYVYAGSVPCLRIDGRLWPLTGAQPLPPRAAERAISEVLDDSQLMQLSLDGELCCSYQLPGGGLRARLHAFAGEQGLQLAVRLLPADAPQAERIGLGPALRILRESPWGLCICSGPAGSGKTTSLWSLARSLSSERALHVVSLESPIEQQFQGGLGLCEQREVGRHVASYAEGIEWALSEAADVIVVGDLLAPGAFAASLRASRARCLVLAGMRASGSLSALSRLLSEPPQDAEHLRFELSYALRLLLHQRLVPKAKVSGCTAAFEQVVNTSQVAQLIRDDKLQQLPTVLASSKNAGMQSLDDALDDLVRASTITLESARAAARRSERFSVKGG